MLVEFESKVSAEGVHTLRKQAKPFSGNLRF